MQQHEWRGGSRRAGGGEEARTVFAQRYRKPIQVASRRPGGDGIIEELRPSDPARAQCAHRNAMEFPQQSAELPGQFHFLRRGEPRPHPVELLARQAGRNQIMPVFERAFGQDSGYRQAAPVREKSQAFGVPLNDMSPKAWHEFDYELPSNVKNRIRAGPKARHRLIGKPMPGRERLQRRTPFVDWLIAGAAEIRPVSDGWKESWHGRRSGKPKHFDAVSAELMQTRQGNAICPKFRS
jgi:hypothetical protein